MFNAETMVVDIGTGFTKVIFCTGSSKGVNILDLVSIQTPENVVDDGKIKNIDAAASYLRRIMEERASHIKKIGFSVTNQGTIMRDVIIPAKKRSDIGKIVTMQVDKFIPVTGREYEIQHRIMNAEKSAEGGIRANVLIGAIKREIVSDYWRLAERLSLTPLYLDSNLHGIYKYHLRNYKFRKNQAEKDEVLCYIEVGESVTSVMVISGVDVVLARSIPLGLGDLDEDFIEYLGCSKADARSAREKLSSNIGNAAKLDLEDLVVRMNGFYERWIAEIDKVMRYYNSKNTGKKINSINLIGYGSKIDRVIQAIEKDISLPVTMASVSDLIAVNKSKNQAVNQNIEAFFNCLSSFITI